MKDVRETLLSYLVLQFISPLAVRGARIVVEASASGRPTDVNYNPSRYHGRGELHRRIWIVGFRAVQETVTLEG